MYFELSEKFNNDFPLRFSIKNYVLSTDLGWKTINGSYGKIVYKGYAYQNLNKFLQNHDPEQMHTIQGSFTAVMEKDNKIYVVTDDNREFPIFIDNDFHLITNLGRKKEVLWPDNFVHMETTEKQINIRYKTCQLDLFPEQGIEDTTNNILHILNKSVKDFTTLYKDPIKIVPTMGLDSMLMIGLLEHNGVEFEIIDYEYKKWTYFHQKNKYKFTTNVGNRIFTKIGHSWGEQPTTLANGWQGDQYFFREYLPLAVLCQIKKIDLHKVISSYRDAYNYEFIMEEITARKSQCEQITKEIRDDTSGYQKIIEIIMGTFESWSFEETCYWSPLKNVKILEQILKMNTKDIIDNALHGTVQKNIIRKINPNILDLIVQKKNNFESLDQTIYQKLTQKISKK